VAHTAKNTLECLIFDVDGTLADTERNGHRLAFNTAFAEYGLNWHWDERLYGDLLAVTGGKERIRHYQDKFLGKRILSDADIARLHARKTEAYVQLLQSGKIPLRPGVKRLIESAREAGLTLAIATTTTPVNVTALLENTLGPGSIDWFQVIAAGDIVSAKKPAPDIYHLVLKETGLTAGQCLALEDSRAGLLSAVNAGVPTLVTFNAYTRQQDFSEALAVTDHLGEVDNPCQVTAGPTAQGYIDLPYLKRLVSMTFQQGAHHVC